MILLNKTLCHLTLNLDYYTTSISKGSWSATMDYFSLSLLCLSFVILVYTSVSNWILKCLTCSLLCILYQVYFIHFLLLLTWQTLLSIPFVLLIMFLFYLQVYYTCFIIPSNASFLYYFIRIYYNIGIC